VDLGIGAATHLSIDLDLKYRSHLYSWNLRKTTLATFENGGTTEIINLHDYALLAASITG
jgi:hypothetical protein